MKRFNLLSLLTGIAVFAVACNSNSEQSNGNPDSLVTETLVLSPEGTPLEPITPPPPPTITEITDTLAPPPPPIVAPKGKKAEDQVKFPPPEVRPDPPKGTSAAVLDGAKIDVAPSPKEGLNQLREKVFKSIKYPDAAMNARTQGVVLVKFTVLENGNLADVRVDKRIGGGLDEIGINAVKASSPWNPGKYQGKPVASSYSFPVSFKLD